MPLLEKRTYHVNMCYIRACFYKTDVVNIALTKWNGHIFYDHI